MGPRLGSWGLTPMDRYSKTGGAREELRPVQIKHRDYIFLILEIKESFPTICAWRSSFKVKGCNVSLPTSLLLASILATRCMRTHGRILR